MIDQADRDPATCTPSARVSDLPEGHVIVVDHDGVVLGEITTETERHVGASAADIMSEGPTTVRADEPLEAFTSRMQASDVDMMLVTTPEGRLLGVYLP